MLDTEHQTGFLTRNMEELTQVPKASTLLPVPFSDMMRTLFLSLLLPLVTGLTGPEKKHDISQLYSHVTWYKG